LQKNAKNRKKTEKSEKICLKKQFFSLFLSFFTKKHFFSNIIGLNIKGKVCLNERKQVMKKLLAALGAIGLLSGAAITVVACGVQPTNDQEPTKNLSDVLTTTTLFDFESTPSEAHILERARTLNPRLLIDQLAVEEVSNTGATIVVRPDATAYFRPASVKVTFTIGQGKTALDDAIVAKDLGRFIGQPSNRDILNKLKELNPNLVISQINVSKNADGQALISVNPGSLIYDESKGSVTVTYTVAAARKKIEDVLTNLALGEFSQSPSAEDILRRVAEQNQELQMDQVEVVNIQDDQATIQVRQGSTVYQTGSVTVTFSVKAAPTLIELSSVLTNDDLGEFDSAPDATRILDQVVALNAQVKIAELEVINLTTTAATVKVKAGSTVYTQGQVVVVFSVAKPKVSLDSVITDLDLGRFTNIPTKQDVLNRVKSKNLALNLNEVTVISLAEGTATIAVNTNSKIYAQGSVQVTFTYGLQSLSDDLTNNILGVVNSADATTILNAVAAINPTLKKTEVEVHAISHGSAQIVVKAGSTIYAQGNITVSFMMPNGVDLTKVIINKDLGEFSFEPTEDDILKQLKALNPNVNTGELEVSIVDSTTAQIGVKAGSTIYDDNSFIEVQYSFIEEGQLQNLANALKNTALGIISANNADAVLARIKNLNPFVDTNQLTVQDLGPNQATIGVKTDSTKYIQGSNVKVTFLLHGLLAVVANVRDLGEFYTALPLTDEQLLKRLGELNPLLVISEVHIENRGETQATIVVNDDSLIYEPGQITVDFSQILLVDINDIIQSRDLGDFNHQPTNEEVLQRLEETNPGLDSSQFEVAANENGHIIIKVRDDSTAYQPGTIDLSYSVVSLINLNRVIVDVQLGEFLSIPEKRDIMHRVKDLNPVLNLNEVHVQSMGNNRAIIAANENSKIYQQGSVTVAYSVANNLDFRGVITITDMGIFAGSPTNDDLLNRVAALNPELKISEIEVVKNENGSATLKVKDNSTIYAAGSIDVIYQVQPTIDLGETITKTDLGIFHSPPTETKILARLEALNPTVVISELQVTAMTNESAILKVKTGSKIYNPGTLKVTYTVQP
jgi:hypothetical protein